MRIKVRWILFPSFVAVVLFAIGVMTAASGVLLEREATQSVERRLKHAIAMLVGSLRICIPTIGPDKCTKMLCQLMERNQTLRFTGLRPDGTFICDSKGRGEEKLLELPEVREALRKGEGAAIRENEEGVRSIYYASYINLKPWGAVVIRVERPFSRIEEIMSHRYTLMYYGGIVALLFGVLLSFWITRTMVKPLEELREGAEQIASGSLDWRVEPGTVEEHAKVAEALNHMAEELAERIREAAKRKEELEAVFEAMTDGLLILNEAGEVVMANASALRMLSCTSKEDCPLRVKAIELAFKRMKLDGGRVQRELELGERHYLIHGRPFDDPVGDEHFYAILIITDITSLRRLEEVRRRFVANVSHELKTPITAIKGYVETMLRAMPDNHPPKIREFMKRIEAQVDRMASIIEDLLILTRVEQEERQGNIETISWDICETIRVVVEDVLPMAREKGIEVKTECEAPMVVSANHSLLRVAIFNLVDNAVKYTQRGGTVRVRAEEEGGLVSIVVEDNGPGIPKEHLPYLFERFYRVDKSRSRKLGGTGLGLSIVKHVVSLHNGTVEVHSTEGEGTTFIIRVPAAVITDPGIRVDEA